MSLESGCRAEPSLSQRCSGVKSRLAHGLLDVVLRVDVVVLSAVVDCQSHGELGISGASFKWFRIRG